MADKSSEPNSLPDEDLQEDKSTADGTQATEGLSTEEESKGLAEKEKKGFQRLIAKKDEKLQDLESRLSEYNSKLSEYERKQREKKLSEMDEVERWKTVAQENAEKAAKMELKSFVSTQLAKANLADHPVSEIIAETPWAIPTVKRRLPSNPTWDETIDAVKSQLPSYLESLGTPDNKATKTEANTESEPEGMETERTQTQTPSTSKSKVWTRAEVGEYLKSAENNPEEYRKRHAVIQKALEDNRIKTS